MFNKFLYFKRLIRRAAFPLVFWIFLALKTLTLIGKKLTEIQRVAIIIAVIKLQLNVNVHIRRKLEGTFDYLLNGNALRRGFSKHLPFFSQQGVNI